MRYGYNNIPEPPVDPPNTHAAPMYHYECEQCGREWGRWDEDAFMCEECESDEHVARTEQSNERPDDDYER